MTNITLSAGQMPAAVPADFNERSPSWWRRMLSTIGAAWRRHVEERTIRAKVQELHDLGDWLLRDIGLTHGAVEHAVRNGHPRDE